MAEHPFWLRHTAAWLLAPLGQRWAHTLGVADRARSFGDVLPAAEFDSLVDAAYLHDIGYAPALAPPVSTRSTARSSCGCAGMSGLPLWSRTTQARGWRRKSAASQTSSTRSRRRSRSLPTRSPTAI